jgi:hypothetical protein
MRDLRSPKRSLRASPKLLALHSQPVASPPDEAAAQSDSPIDPNLGGAKDEPSSRPRWAKQVINGAGTALWFGCLSSAYSPAAAGDLKTVLILLSAGWLLAITAFLSSDALAGWSKRARRLVSTLVCVTLAALTAFWGALIFQPPHVEVKEGARIVWTTNPFSKGDTKVVVAGTNRGDMSARVGVVVGSFYTLVDHQLTDDEEKQGFEKARGATPPIQGNGLEFLRGGNRSHNIPIQLTSEQFDDIISGNKYLYVFAVTRFTDSLTPAGRENLAELCAHFHGPLDSGYVCKGYNESRALDEFN